MPKLSQVNGEEFEKPPPELFHGMDVDVGGSLSRATFLETILMASVDKRHSSLGEG